MKVKAIIFFVLFTGASASFFDVFRGAMSSVAASFENLVSDVVTDVKDTIDCSILAVKQVLALEGDNSNTPYYDKICKGKSRETPYVQNNHDNISSIVQSLISSAESVQSVKLETRNVSEIINNAVKNLHGELAIINGTLNAHKRQELNKNMLERDIKTKTYEFKSRNKDFGKMLTGHNPTYPATTGLWPESTNIRTRERPELNKDTLERDIKTEIHEFKGSNKDFGKMLTGHNPTYPATTGLWPESTNIRTRERPELNKDTLERDIKTKTHEFKGSNKDFGKMLTGHNPTYPATTGLWPESTNTRTSKRPELNKDMLEQDIKSKIHEFKDRNKDFEKIFTGHNPTYPATTGLWQESTNTRTHERPELNKDILEQDINTKIHEFKNLNKKITYKKENTNAKDNTEVHNIIKSAPNARNTMQYIASNENDSNETISIIEEPYDVIVKEIVKGKKINAVISPLEFDSSYPIEAEVSKNIKDTNVESSAAMHNTVTNILNDSNANNTQDKIPFTSSDNITSNQTFTTEEQFGNILNTKMFDPVIRTFEQYDNYPSETDDWQDIQTTNAVDIAEIHRALTDILNDYNKQHDIVPFLKSDDKHSKETSSIIKEQFEKKDDKKSKEFDSVISQFGLDYSSSTESGIRQDLENTNDDETAVIHNIITGISSDSNTISDQKIVPLLITKRNAKFTTTEEQIEKLEEDLHKLKEFDSVVNKLEAHHQSEKEKIKKGDEPLTFLGVAKKIMKKSKQPFTDNNLYENEKIVDPTSKKLDKEQEKNMEDYSLYDFPQTAQDSKSLERFIESSGITENKMNIYLNEMENVDKTVFDNLDYDSFG